MVHSRSVLGLSPIVNPRLQIPVKNTGLHVLRTCHYASCASYNRTPLCTLSSRDIMHHTLHARVALRIFRLHITRLSKSQMFYSKSLQNKGIKISNIPIKIPYITLPPQNDRRLACLAKRYACVRNQRQNLYTDLH